VYTFFWATLYVRYKDGKYLLTGEIRGTRRIACSRVTLPATNPTWTALGRDEMQRVFFIRD